MTSLRKLKNKIMEDITRGGQFLVKETKCENVFTPEDFNEEQIMMRDSVKEFVDKELWAHKDKFEKKITPTQNKRCVTLEH